VTLTKSLALEAASHGVRVVSIAPVATETPMLPTFMGKRVVDEEGAPLRGHRAARTPQPAGGPGAHGRVPGLGRRRDDHRTCIEVDGGRCI